MSYHRQLRLRMGRERDGMIKAGETKVVDNTYTIGLSVTLNKQSDFPSSIKIPLRAQMALLWLLEAKSSTLPRSSSDGG